MAAGSRALSTVPLVRTLALTLALVMMPETIPPVEMVALPASSINDGGIDWYIASPQKFYRRICLTRYSRSVTRRSSAATISPRSRRASIRSGTIRS